MGLLLHALVVLPKPSFLESNLSCWVFYLTDLNQAILGADFLRANNLIIDQAKSPLIDPESNRSINGHVGSAISPSLILIESSVNAYDRLLNKYPQLLIPFFDNKAPKHGIYPHLPTTGHPVFSKARRLNDGKTRASKDDFKSMLKLGIVRRSKSNYSSAMHVVPKMDGSWRFCGDYRSLNDCTVPDRYPVPQIQDFATGLHGSFIFSKVDVVRGYNQIPMVSEDVHKTTVITPFGLFEWIKMAFGLKNAAQTFQCMTDSVLGDLSFIFVYLDDILIASKSEVDHLQHLKILFDRLSENGLILNGKKCEFGQTAIPFLGHHISSQGIEPLPDRV